MGLIVRNKKERSVRSQFLNTDTGTYVITDQQKAISLVMLIKHKRGEMEELSLKIFFILE